MASTQYHCFLLLLSLANLIPSISKFIGKLKLPENVRKKIKVQVGKVGERETEGVTWLSRGIVPPVQ